MLYGFHPDLDYNQEIISRKTRWDTEGMIYTVCPNLPLSASVIFHVTPPYLDTGPRTYSRAWWSGEIITEISRSRWELKRFMWNVENSEMGRCRSIRDVRCDMIYLNVMFPPGVGSHDKPSAWYAARHASTFSHIRSHHAHVTGNERLAKTWWRNFEIVLSGVDTVVHELVNTEIPYNSRTTDWGHHNTMLCKTATSLIPYF